MKIHIVTVNEEGWVLKRIADSFALHLPATVSTQPDQSADINFYVNYPLFKARTTCDVGFFTHRDESGSTAEAFDSVAREIDWCIAMSENTAQKLPATKTSIVHIPADPQFFRSEIVIGICGREYPSGRKQFHLIPELEKIVGIKIITTNEKYAFSEMPEFYRQIDYLLVLSNNEGGPLPVREAIAMGKPVIAPNVGYAWEYPCIRYSDHTELPRLLKSLTTPKNAWEIASSQLVCIFRDLLRTRTV